jgi:hypothetical protein
MAKEKTKKYFLNVVEYGIFNPRYEGQRCARIEVLKEGEDYAVWEGFIDADEETFLKIREILDFKEFDQVPFIRLDYKEKEKDETIPNNNK